MMQQQQASPPGDIHAVLQRYWGYSGFRPVQEAVIRSVLDGRDTLALLPTGGGKSLCFQVPALAMGRLCLVVSPLIALMKDQVSQLRSRGIAARAIISGMSHAEIDNTLESAALGKLSFLYVSPERLGTELFMGRLPRLPIGLIAVDEAHCISQWGYDFRPSYLTIAELRERVPEVPVLALTASATPEVATDIMTRLAFRQANLLRGAFHRPELVLRVGHLEDKSGRLLQIMEHVPGSSIVYVRDRRGTVRTAQFLQQHGVSAAAYHAGMSGEERDRIQQAWTEGSIRCVAATNAFGMGIDKADVRSVVHLEPPPDLESYYQEAGRGGRDGRTAYAFLLVGPGDVDRLRERQRSAFPTLADVRKVYQGFADMHAIALGSGLHETYELDLATLSKRCSLPPVTVLHALKALELDGRIVQSEGLRTPSRLMFTADPSVVYHLRVNDRRAGPLIEALLRLHGGLFEEAALIDEARLARLIDQRTDKVIAMIKALDQQRVLSYRPRNDKPAITLLQPRADAQRLALDPVALRDRERRAVIRLEAMVRYLESVDMCRARILLNYFGEPLEQDCGRCDICRERRLPRAAGLPDKVAKETNAVYEMDVDALRRMIDEEGGLV